MTWAGEDWGSSPSEKLYPSSHIPKGHGMAQEEDEKDRGFSSYSATSGGGGGGGGSKEVKIKITKKQLEELLGRADVKDMSLQQVLEQLIRVSDGLDRTHHRSWRPALQSIPE